LRFRLFLFLLVCVTGTASAVDIPSGHISGYSLNSAGTTYVLTGNILANTNAFSVAANDIVLDGNGYKIDCGLNGTGIGLKSYGKNNLTIKNLIIVQHNSDSLSHGILIQNTENTKIINSTASSIGGAGISVIGNNVTVDRCIASSVSGRALYLNVNNSMITNSTAVSSSSYGMEFSNSNTNLIQNCIAQAYSGNGISLIASNNNYFSNCAGFSNSSHGIYLSRCTYNTFTDSIGYTNSTSSGDGVYISDSTNNTFDQVTASSCLKTGFFLNNMTIYNNFTNCTGESYGEDSLYNGIWFAFPEPECAGTNIYTNFVSHSNLVKSSTNLNLVKFLVIGDSITAGGAAGLPYGAYAYYANLSPGNRYSFYNVGLANETADKGRLRFVDEVNAYKPEYVSIMYGANDMKYDRPQQDVIDDILWMAAKAKASGVTPIILLTPARKGYETTTIDLDKSLNSQAVAAGYHVFNVYDTIDTVPNNGDYDGYNSKYYVDNVHPNQAGNKLIGDAFAKYTLSLSSQGQVQSSPDFIDYVFSTLHSSMCAIFRFIGIRS